MRRVVLAPIAALLLSAVVAPAAPAASGYHVPWPSLLPGLPSGEAAAPKPVPHCRSLRMRCVDRLVVRLRRDWRRADAACDHRVIFALGYLRITREIRKRLQAGETFSHRRWFIGVVQGFSNLYFDSARRHRTGRALPESWRIYYEAMDSGDFNAGQDLLLASNAHTNHDLPYAYAASGLLSASGRSRKPDHDGVNDVNASVFEGLADTYAERYDPFFGLSNLGHPLDGLTALQAVQLWRENAWRKAEALVGAPSPAERRAVEREIEAEATAWANLIAAGGFPGHRAERDAFCAASH